MTCKRVISVIIIDMQDKYLKCRIESIFETSDRQAARKHEHCKRPTKKKRMHATLVGRKICKALAVLRQLEGASAYCWTYISTMKKLHRKKRGWSFHHARPCGTSGRISSNPRSKSCPDPSKVRPSPLVLLNVITGIPSSRNFLYAVMSLVCPSALVAADQEFQRRDGNS